MVNYFFNPCCNQTLCLELIHRNKWGTNCVNCGYLSELSHPNELHFIVVGSCEAENVHISQKITLDTASANSFIGSGTAPKVLLGGRAQSWLSYFCLGGDLLIFANYISLRVNSILVITECYVKQSIHTLPDKENILGWLFSGCQFADQKRILFICRRVDEGLVVFDSHSLPGYVEWLAVKVCLMYICLIRLPREEWISLVTLLHIFTHQ